MWDTFIINPMTNILLWLYGILGNNFILALTIFTILTRVIMLPLNLRQQRSMAKTQEMQPQIRAIQNKYKDNPQKMQEEFQKIGYNPAESLTGCLPLVATMPILFGLFQVLRLVLSTTPQSLFELTQRSYSWINLTELLPINSQFLWLNLGQPDQFYILPVLVFITMFFQTRFTTPSSKKKQEANKKSGKGGKNDEDPTAAMTQSMQYTMPIMFGFFSLSFPSGLSIYFVLSNLISMAQGLYTRNIIEREKTEQEERKNLAAMGMTGDVIEGEKISEPITPQPPVEKKKPQSTKKTTSSKRKRRSAKR
jgi:YidC/Oxa1 family membrane protein insertase